MRFEVPQFIDVEDKIFGPFTFKQFLYLAGGAGLLGGSRLLRLAVSADEGTAARASANGSVAGKFVYENGAGGSSVLGISYNANGAGFALPVGVFHRTRAVLRGLDEALVHQTLDDLLEDLGGQRLEIGAVCKHWVARHRRGVRGHEDDLVASRAERSDGVSSGCVELAALADHRRAGADHEDTLHWMTP